MRIRFAIICLFLAGIACAQSKAQERKDAAPPKPEASPAASASEANRKASEANRKAYEALYSDILKTLPQDGRLKIDSARGRSTAPKAKPSVVPAPIEERKKEAVEKHRKNLDDLSPEVKARVDKAVKDLEKRRKEKKTEFKELKP